MEENIGQRILSKDLENIVKKVASGKTLTNSERALIENEYGEKGKSVRYTASGLWTFCGINTQSSLRRVLPDTRNKRLRGFSLRRIGNLRKRILRKFPHLHPKSKKTYCCGIFSRNTAKMEKISSALKAIRKRGQCMGNTEF